MAIGSSYSQALAEAQRYGAGSRVVPVSVGRGGATYRAVPGPGRTTRGGYSGMPAPQQPSGSSLTPAASKAFQKAMAFYKPGGGFGKGVEAGLERGRTKSMASGMQSLVGSGLAGTTMAAGLGKKYEEEVAAPTRAGVESERARSLSSLSAAMGGAEQAGFESAASRSMSEYLARLQSGTSVQLAGMNRPTRRTSFAPAMRTVTRSPSGSPMGGRLNIPKTAPSLFAPASTSAPTFAPFTAAERTSAKGSIARTGSRLMSPEAAYQGGWTG